MATYRREDLVNRVRQGADLTKIAVENSDLSGAPLAGAKLRTATFTKVTFEDADLSGSDLRQARLENCMLRRGNLSQANLRQTKLQACLADQVNASKLQGDGLVGEKISLREANLEESSLAGAQFLQSTFEGANARRSNMEGMVASRTVFTSANLTGSQLRGAEFQSCDLRKCYLEGIDLSSTKFTSSVLSNAILTRCQLRGVNFSGLDLEGADLTEVSVVEGKFLKAKAATSKYRNATIQATYFDGSDLNNAFFMGANIQSASFKQCNLEDAYFSGAALDNVDFSEARLNGVNFSGAKLTKLKLAGADLRNTNFEGAALNSVNFAGAKNLLLARWSPAALESFARTKMKEAMQADFQGLVGIMQALKQRGDTEAVVQMCSDLEKIYRDMGIMIEPQAVRREIEGVIRWLHEQGKKAESQGDIIEAEDCADKMRAIVKSFADATGETLEIRQAGEGPKHFFTFGIDDSGLVVQNFAVLLQKLNETYSTGVANSGDDEFGGLGVLDNLFFQPLLLTGSHSDPWEVTFSGEPKGLSLLSWIFLHTMAQQGQTELKKVLSELEQIKAERDQAQAGDPRSKLLAEKLQILDQKARLMDDAVKHLRRGQSELVRQSTGLKVLTNDDWKSIDAETKGTRHDELKNLIIQSKIGGRLALQLEERSAFDVTFRLIG